MPTTLPDPADVTTEHSADPEVTTLMTTPVIALVPAAMMTVALQLMAARDIRHIPIMDGHTCLGVLSDTDVVREVALGTASTTRVIEQMRALPRISSVLRRSAAAHAMRIAATDALLVVDGDKVIGIVTSSDLIRSLAAEDEHDAEMPGATTNADSADVG